jgi:hypothetical protein
MWRARARHLLLGFSMSAMLAAAACAPSDPAGAIKVLFIGNSYIFKNDLPGMLESLGDAPDSSQRISAHSVTIPGASLAQLWQAGIAKAVIDQGKWDYIILQEGAPTLSRNATRTDQYARLFDQEIKKSGSKTIMFLPWAHEAGNEHQPDMDQATYKIANELGAKVAPVGLAWSIAESLEPNIVLYSADGRHPTVTGSYLAACTLYLVIVNDQKSCPPIDRWGMSNNDMDIARKASSQSIERLPP